MEKEITKNRQATEMTLITAVSYTHLRAHERFRGVGDQCGSSQGQSFKNAYLPLFQFAGWTDSSLHSAERLLD